MLNEMNDDWVRESELANCCAVIGNYFYEEPLEFAEMVLRILLEERLVTIGEYNSDPWALSVDESIERAMSFLKLPHSSEFRDEGFWLTITSKGKAVVSELDEVFRKI